MVVMQFWPINCRSPWYETPLVCLFFIKRFLTLITYILEIRRYLCLSTYLPAFYSFKAATLHRFQRIFLWRYFDSWGRTQSTALSFNNKLQLAVEAACYSLLIYNSPNSNTYVWCHILKWVLFLYEYTCLIITRLRKKEVIFFECIHIYISLACLKLK